VTAAASGGPSAEERLTDLEIRYAHQAQLLTALDDVLREFAGRVVELERQIAALRAAGGEDGVPANAEEKPPHY
jgi:uncharacterized coiled-coil protein SlyX